MKPHFLRTLAMNAIVFTVFAFVYLLIDFDAHFICTDSRHEIHGNGKISTSARLYYAMMNHSAVGCNDILPKTDFARILTSIHVMLAWLVLCTLAAQ